MFEIAAANEISKAVCHFPEKPLSISTNRIRNDKVAHELLKAMKNSEPLAALSFAILSCAVNQNRLVFALTKAKTGEMAATAGLTFDTAKYRQLIETIVQLGHCRIVLEERGSWKPVVIEIIQPVITERLKNVDVVAQTGRTLEFVNDESRFETKKPRPTGTVAKKVEPIIRVELSLPDFSNLEPRLKPTKETLNSFPGFVKKFALALSKIGRPGTKLKEHEEFASKFAELAKMNDMFFNEWGDLCQHFYVPTETIKTLAEERIAARFTDTDGRFSLNGEIAEQVRSVLNQYLAVAFKNRYCPQPVERAASPSDWHRYRSIEKVIEKNRDLEMIGRPEQITDVDQDDLDFHAEILEREKIRDMNEMRMKLGL